MLSVLIAAAALAQVRTVNTLPASPVAIATDTQGYIYVAMNTDRTDLPAVNSYQSHVVLSSRDLGTTWTSVGDFPEATLAAIAADPANPGALLVATGDGIWKTTDTGAHWRRVLSYQASDVAPHDIAYDPAVPGHVLTVGYGSMDGGESWVPFQILAPTHWGPFAFDPRGNGVVFEGGGSGYRSMDGGRTWAQVPYAEPWRSFAFDSRRPGVVYGLGFSLSGVYVSTDDGATFSATTVPFQNPTYPQYQDGLDDLFADPAHPGRIYVITESGILYRSDDVAQTWQLVYSAAFPYRSPMVRTCSALAYVIDDWATLIRSVDDGNTWQTVGPAPGYRLASGAGCLIYGSAGNTQNGYIAKYSSDGKLLWGAYVGGDLPITSVTSLAVAADGSLAVGGISSQEGASYAWASKLDPAGNTVFSKTLGGGSDSVSAAAIDSTGAVWLAGATSSANFPVTPDAIQSNLAGGKDAFLAKLDVTGALVYATFIGTEGDDAATSVAMDSRNRVVVGGYLSSRFVMLARLDLAASRLDQFAQPGTSAPGDVDAIAIGADDAIYATGTTPGVFPVTLPPFANSLNSSPTLSSPCRTPGDRFLLRLDPDTLAPIYSRLFGAQCTSSKSAGLQVRPDGTAIVASAPDESFPERAEITLQGPRQLAEVAPDGGSLLFSSPLPCCDIGLAPEPDGTLLVADGSSLARVTLPDSPLISLDHVGNAFSGTALEISPGAIYALTGSGIGPDTSIWLGFAAKDAPTELGGARVWFNDTPVPLLYSSSSRLICLVPPGLQGSVTLQVEYAGSKSNAVQASVGTGNAGLLTAAFPDIGWQAYAKNEDGSLNGPDNPASAGSTVTFYATGFPPLPSFMASPWYPPSMTCQASPTLDDTFVAGLYRVPCTIGTSPQYARAGAVALQMAWTGTGFFGSYTTYFGNAVTIYLKSQ